MCFKISILSNNKFFEEFMKNVYEELLLKGSLKCCLCSALLSTSISCAD